jgi:hypothetical protein
MSKEDEYRRHAADILDLARRATSATHKTRLLVMADAWLDLADRVHRVARRRAQIVRGLHPLLRSKVFPRGSKAE